MMNQFKGILTPFLLKLLVPSMDKFYFWVLTSLEICRFAYKCLLGRVSWVWISVNPFFPFSLSLSLWTFFSFLPLSFICPSLSFLTFNFHAQFLFYNDQWFFSLFLVIVSIFLILIYSFFKIISSREKKGNFIRKKVQFKRSAREKIALILM